MNQEQRPDIINPLEDTLIEENLNALTLPDLTITEQRLRVLAWKLWQHIQRLDGAWRIQQDRLIRLEEDQEFARRLEEMEERLKEVERWQDREDTYQLEQSEYND